MFLNVYDVNEGRELVDMAQERRHRYVEGNTVRKIQSPDRPDRRQKPERHERRKPSVKKHIQYVNVFYTIFLAAAACMVLWSGVNYLQLQAELTGKIKNIASLEMQLENLRKENDDNYTRIMTSVDLDYIKEVAINELGMVYADEDQVILYDGGTRDYVRQNEEIPKEEKTLMDQIRGK